MLGAIVPFEVAVSRERVGTDAGAAGDVASEVAATIMLRLFVLVDIASSLCKVGASRDITSEAAFLRLLGALVIVEAILFLECLIADAGTAKTAWEVEAIVLKEKSAIVLIEFTLVREHLVAVMSSTKGVAQETAITIRRLPHEFLFIYFSLA